MERWNNKVAVVTGASSGIGAAVAARLAKEGLTVVGLARRKAPIEDLAKSTKGNLHALSVDITKEEEILTAFKWIKGNLGPIHVLINSAGVGRVTKLIDGETTLWKDILDTNVMGLCVATREAVKNMRANNVQGHVVHVNSIAGHQVFNIPDTSVYPASKHAVTALTETLRQELNAAGSKIKITSVSPGLVATSIFETGAAASGKGGASQKKQELFKTMPSLQPEDVADAIVYVLATPPHVQVHELTIKPVGEKF